MGGIFAQSSMDFNAINMYTRALKASENVRDISYVLHYKTPGGTQRGDVSISQNVGRGTFLLKYGSNLHENICQ